MTFTHLMDCLALTYGPIYTIYYVKDINKFQGNNLFLKSMLHYVFYSVAKMLLFATIIPSQIGGSSLSLTQEFIKMLIKLTETIFLLRVLKKDNNSFEDPYIKILAIALGWCFAESLFSNFFYFLINAMGSEFTWDYVKVAVNSNIELFEKISIVTLLDKLTNTFKQRKDIIIIGTIFFKYFASNLGYSLLGLFNNEGFNNFVSKVAFELSFGFIIYMFVEKLKEGGDKKKIE